MEKNIGSFRWDGGIISSGAAEEILLPSSGGISSISPLNINLLVMSEDK